MLKKPNDTKPTFPYTEWEVVEKEFAIENNYLNETVFALGNGYFGMRGNFEEGYSGPAGTGLEGNYINGFYDIEFIKYPEIAYGYAERGQTMLNITNGKIIKLFVDGEEFDMLRGEISEYQRVLSFKTGILSRSMVWSSPQGKKVKIGIRRLVSLSYQHLAVIDYEITPLNFDGKIKLCSILDGNVQNLNAGSDPRIGSGFQGRPLTVEKISADADYGEIIHKTGHSHFTLVCAMFNQVSASVPFTVKNHIGEFTVESDYEFAVTEGVKIKLTKYISVADSREHAASELPAQVKSEVIRGSRMGFDTLMSEQIKFLADFWERADVVIKGDPAIQQGIRFNIFHLLQSVGRDGKTNIAAKGLTGEGYGGHYFWDTEMYILPFFLYNNHEISRKLLEYRYYILDKARERARQMAHERGALYPWRTINGEECSAFFPAGTAQYHINADIAFAIKKYMEATEDREFLVKFGAEILFETARLWADLGDFIPKNGNKFCINTVTGPDEYTAIVNNNCYTNLMARENLAYAYEVSQWMQHHEPERFKNLALTIGLTADEPEFWKKAADNMYVPYDPELEIHMQDDSFLDRIPWDFKNTPPEKYPLLMHFHPLVIYRHQVCKQADLVLALFLLGNKFTMDQKKRNFDYYEKVTTHDSSLSTCIFSIVASEVGYSEKAYQYFLSTARMDLDNMHGNTRDGIHAANMAGTWLCLVNGFAGMRVYDGVLYFNPYIPESWDEYSFKVVFRERTIRVKVDKNGTVYELMDGEPIEIFHHGEKWTLK